MDTKTDRIVIVGGGSAGWMTAATIIRAYPDKNVTLLESPTISTIGIGESSLPEMNYWVDFLGIDWDELFVEAEATWKISGKFVDFIELNHEFYVTTAYLNHDDYFDKHSELGVEEWWYKKQLFPNTPDSDFYEYHFPQYHMIKNNAFTRDENPNLYPFKPNHHGAIQLNAIKFAEYLKNKYAKPRGVKHILGTVKEVVPREDGAVKHLILSDGSILEGDLFVDCTGFKSLLLGEFLKVPFKSTLDILPHNRAFFAPVEYTDKNIEMDSMATATGLGNGWAWNTPVWSRLGTGYTWSDEFIDEEGALQEFKNHLDSKNMAVFDPNRSKKTEIKSVNVKNGYYEKSFVKNVVAIGLSSGFMDPLEASGLFFIMSSALALTTVLNRSLVSDLDRAIYNEELADITEMYLQFIPMHFQFTRRDDTPYWKKWRERPTNNIVVRSIAKTTVNRAWHEFSSTRLAILHGANYPVVKPSTGYFPYRQNIPNYDNLTKAVLSSIKKREELINMWKHEISTLPSQYEYLKKKLYDR